MSQQNAQYWFENVKQRFDENANLLCYHLFIEGEGLALQIAIKFRRNNFKCKIVQVNEDDDLYDLLIKNKPMAVKNNKTTISDGDYFDRVLPRQVHDLRRFEELAKAIKNCLDIREPLPKQWVDEANDIIHNIKNGMYD